MKHSTLRKVLVAFVVLAMMLSVIGTAAASELDALKYYTDFESMADAKAAAEALSTELVADGAILMKNDGALPLKNGAWVSVFGVRADNLMGASDSAGAWSSDAGGTEETVAAALSGIGFNVNPTLKAFYDRDSSSIGNETTAFGGMVESSFEIYKDAAFILFSREGGEGSDAPTTKAANGAQEPAEEGDTHKALYTVDGVAYKHSLMLTKSEIALVEYVKAQGFRNIIIVLNTSNAMEINDLKNDSAINAIIDICRPGVGGLKGFAQIIAGLVSPSGHLVDEWPVDFTADPTWYNFGNNSQTGTSSTYLYEDGTATGSAGTSTSATNAYHGIDYEEGIYLGYKYYETYYYDMYQSGKAAAAQEWYKNNVAFPFGYGLSYTTFSMNIAGLYTDEAMTKSLGSGVSPALFNSDLGSEAQVETLYLKVNVQNTGDVAGKELVQVYVTAPYFKGGIEKSSVVLTGFAKTSVLQPGETETVKVAFKVQDFASFDYLDANKDGVKGDYELDSGNYIVRVMESSHFDCSTNTSNKTDAYDQISFNLSGTAHLKLDDFSGKLLENLFSEENGVYTAATQNHDMAFNATRTAGMMADGTSGMTVMSRADFDGTFPKAPTAGDLTFYNSILDNWSYWDQFKVDDTPVMSNGLPTSEKKRDASFDQETDPWYKTAEDIPANWTQAAGTYEADHLVQYNRKSLNWPMYVSSAAQSPIKFAEMAGVEWDDPKWDEFLNQLTYDELCTLIEFNGYCTPDVGSVEKAKSLDSDGPNNFSSTHCWPSEDLIASTWNVELAEKEGSHGEPRSHLR